jgi:hypothetical protein
MCAPTNTIDASHNSAFEVDLDEHDVCAERTRDDGVASFVDRESAIIGIEGIDLANSVRQRIADQQAVCSHACTFVHGCFDTLPHWPYAPHQKWEDGNGARVGN